MAGISSVTALRDGLPELLTIHDYKPQPEDGEVTIDQQINIRDNRRKETDWKMLKRDDPKIHIRGLVTLHGDRLRFRVVLETEGQVEEKTPAKINWKVELVKQNAFEDIGGKTKFVKLPPQNIPRKSDEYLEIKIQDIKPDWRQDGIVNLKWQANLVWFYHRLVVEQQKSLIFCCHQMCDILETVCDRLQLHEPVDEETDGAGVQGLHFRN